MYKIFYDANNVTPYYVAVWTGTFWQQCTPSYLYEHSCFKWAKRNNIVLAKQTTQPVAS